jgi:ABC-type lipoprotein release transport system permease subunit
MQFYLKLACRNIFRNRRRTFLTGLIIGIGLAAMIFVDAYIVGMKDSMISSATSSFLGQAQIHRQGFQDSQNAGLTISQADRVTEQLRKDPNIQAFTERTLSFGTISAPADIASVVICGIAPDSERGLSKIDESMIDGSYLGADQNDSALIGQKLAEHLKVGVGDRIVLTVSQAGSGELSQTLFRVGGVFVMHINELDSATAFVSLGSAQGMLGIDRGVHEIAIQFRRSQYATEAGEQFSGEYSRFGNVAETWQQLIPQLKYVLDMTNISIAVTVILVFAMIVFGIINTMFMALYERTFEFGVLRAVGTRPARLRNLIVFEAGALAVYAVALGMILGAGLTLVSSLTGLDLTGVELAGTTFTSRIYPVFSLRQFIMYPLLVFAFTCVVSLYPAGHASRMSVAQALQRAL